MPVGDVLVGDTGSDIEHDDTALAVDVVTVTEATELLLASGIPDIELNLTQVLFRRMISLVFSSMIVGSTSPLLLNHLPLNRSLESRCCDAGGCALRN